MKSLPIRSIVKQIISFLFHTGTIVVIMAVCAGLYAGTIRGVNGNVQVDRASHLTDLGQPFESSHERAPYALMLSIDEDHSINLSKRLADFGSPDVGFYKDKYFILFPPGVSLLIYPLYLIGKSYGMSQLFAYTTIPLLGLGSILLLYAISLKVFKLPRWASWVSGILFAFGTTSWSYAITIYQHIPLTFFILLGFYSAWNYKQKGMLYPLWGFLTWASLGMGLFIDFPSIFLMTPIMMYFFFSSFVIAEKKDRTTISFSLIFIVSSVIFWTLIGAHGYYNQKAFGDWKKFGQAFTRFEGDEKFAERIEREQREATDSAILKPKKSGSSNPFSIFKERNVIRGLTTLTIADDKGIFYYSPVLLMGLAGILWFRKKLKQEHYILISVVIVNMMLYASFADPWGGWAYGPRYLIPSMAILSLFTVLTMNWFSTHRLAARLAFFPLFVASSAIATLGVMTTNIVPPSVEGIPLGLPYNYIANIFYLLSGKTGNYFYLNYLSSQITLPQYAAIMYGIVLLIVFVLLFIAPLFSKKYES